MENIQTTLEGIDKKLDAIMKHLGCGSEEEYKEMSSEEKDAADEKEVLGDKEEE